MVLPCEENERGAHSENNARCGHTREKKKRAAKPKWKDACNRDMKEAGSKEDNAKTKWRKQVISYTLQATPDDGTSQGRRIRYYFELKD